MGKHCAILQITGYQNSGKTTLMKKLIARAADQGLAAGSLKHHGHGGTPDLPLKDSTGHFKAGAIVAGAEGEGTLQLSVRLENHRLDRLIELYSFFDLDVLFIEGYKKDPFPKVLLISKEEDFPLFHELQGIMCVISNRSIQKEHFPGVKHFFIDEEDLYLDFLMKEVAKQNGRDVI
ncbi:molybdopterin-guanine dinucleotide biosynthesis protein B [Bacillus sp. SJS]|uniref:molybdopterin-guanine dinucleotide biosynthesis protein B n=1 Tax=Bacillus sp. SJS TaxID=1423321 RepID=UPI000A9EF84A|nr:molybdopterin-guanine dinucleotide biosynthesis protein B [Bacillus sp. SJS]